MFDDVFQFQVAVYIHIRMTLGVLDELLQSQVVANIRKEGKFIIIISSLQIGTCNVTEMLFDKWNEKSLHKWTS